MNFSLFSVLGPGNHKKPKIWGPKPSLGGQNEGLGGQNGVSGGPRGVLGGSKYRGVWPRFWPEWGFGGGLEGFPRLRRGQKNWKFWKITQTCYAVFWKFEVKKKDWDLGPPPPDPPWPPTPPSRPPLDPPQTPLGPPPNPHSDPPRR
jgi:hypothetical protein